MPEESSTHTSSAPRIVAIIAVIVVFILLIIVSFSMRETTADKVWDMNTTVGSADAKTLYVMYTDLACPYCDVFSRATLEHWDEFTAYLAEHDILYEIRLTDALYMGNNLSMSRDSAEAAYCAKRENKFWEYYHGALTALWNDYHSKGIGSSKTATPIRDMPDDYWLQIGLAAGLGDDFANCVASHDTRDEVTANTVKALQVSEGMPTFKFGKFTTSGFGETWGWDYVKMYLDAGL